MLTHLRRTPARLAVAAPVAALTVVALTALPAAADVPEAWEETQVSGLQFILVLVVFPLLLIGLVTLLSSLGGWRKGEQYVPGQAWRSEAEWFGGRRGVEGADQQKAIEAGERGGTSGSW